MKHPMAGLALALAMTAAGCGGAPKKPAAPAGPTCADVGANTERLFNEEATKIGEDMHEIAATTRDVVSERCTADAWSPDAIACFASATSEQMEGCAAKLTPAQNQAVEDAMKAKIEAYAGERAKDSAPAEGAPPGDPCGGDE
jgi:hypothetical protein